MITQYFQHDQFKRCHEHGTGFDQILKPYSDVNAPAFFMSTLSIEQISLRHKGPAVMIVNNDIRPIQNNLEWVKNKKDLYFISTSKLTSVYLDGLGLDFVFSLEFNQELKKLSAENFLQKLSKFANIKSMIVSLNTKIGADQISGKELKSLCKKLAIDVFFINMKNIDEDIISSSIISNLLCQGKIINANNYLGEKYTLSGKVEKGDQIGRTIGFPTANINLQEKIQIPSDGIYACYVKLGDKLLFGALSIGNRPTIKNDSSHKIEVFIIDFKENIYDEIIEVLIVDKVRDQVDFGSLDDLKNQMKKDIIKIKKILNKENE